MTFRSRLIDTVRQSVIVTNVDGTITLWNRFAEDLYGWAAEEVLGRNIVDVTPSEMTRAQAETIMSRLSMGEPWTGEFLVRRKDGYSFWAEVSDTPILDDEGHLVGIIGVSGDVTDRRQTSEALRDAEARYRSLIEHLPLVTYSEQVGTGVVYTSPQIMELIGVTREEWLAEPDVWIAHVHPNDRAMVSAAMERTDESGEPFSLDHRFITRDGRVVWVRNEAMLHRDAQRNPLHWQGFLLDITEQKGANERERLLAAISESLQAVLDPEETLRRLVSFLVPAFADWCSVILVEDDGSLKRVAVVHADLGKAYLASALLDHPLDPTAPYGLPAVARSGRSEVYSDVPDVNATAAHAEAMQSLGVTSQMNVPLVAHGRVIGAIGLNVGDSGRRYTEDDLPFIESIARRAALAIDNARLHHALQRSETKHCTLIEHIPAVTYIEPADVASGTAPTLFISRQIEQITGYAVENWQTIQNFNNRIVHPDDREQRMRELRRTDATGEPYEIEYRIIHRDGHIVWVRNEAVLIRDDDGAPGFWQGLLVDISERKYAEQLVRDSESKYRALMDNIPAVAYIEMLDSSGSAFMSPQIVDMLGYPLEAWAISPDFWLSVTHPDDIEPVCAEMRRTDETGEPFDIEQRFIKPDGQIVWVHSTAILHRDADGTPLYWQGFLVDITAQKVAEMALREREHRFRALV